VEVAEQLRAEGERQALDRGQVLDPDRHAGERALVPRPDGVGRRQGALLVQRHERVQRRVERLDALERGLDQLPRRHLSLADEVAQLGDRTVEEVGGGGG
jgi:hypothetical protein